MSLLDAYGHALSRVLFPLYELLRGRPTVALLDQLRRSESSPIEVLVAHQLASLRRLLDHARSRTIYYRQALAEHDPQLIRTLDDLAQLPLLDRTTAVTSLEQRTSTAEPWTIQKSTSGTTGQPVVVRYGPESRHWRDAIRLRGYGWAGYAIGRRTLHYWGIGLESSSWLTRKKVDLDHALKRDRYVDCTPRSKEALTGAIDEIRRFRPEVIVAYASGVAALARFVIEQRLRDWDQIPVITGAERLWPRDRTMIEEAFGPVFETYGSREVMLIGSECEMHDGFHVSMENLIVELVVRERDGSSRHAKPGEVGEVAITDLHNLACPMIRYLTGDLAVARSEEACACGRTLARIGPIDGRVAHTLRDGYGNPVGGLVFNILFGVLEHVALRFQVVQRRDQSVALRVVPRAEELPSHARDAIHQFARRYLPATHFEIEYVADIPLGRNGKRTVVVVES